MQSVGELKKNGGIAGAKVWRVKGNRGGGERRGEFRRIKVEGFLCFFLVAIAAQRSFWTA